jgi:hypothetical protein
MVTDRDIVVRAVAADRGGGTTAVREVMSGGRQRRGRGAPHGGA